MRPLVSVIIPTYGSPVFLGKAIESVLNQTFQDWELIIVDDNDPNSEARLMTSELIQSFSIHSDRIKYIKHKHNLNGAVARNTGLAVATGEFIALLDSDDEYMPTRLQKCYDEMQKAPDCVAGVYTGCEFRRRGKVYKEYKGVKSGRFVKETLACTFMFCTGSNVFVRKRVIDELNGFDPSFLRQQDYEFLVRLFENYSLIGLPDILVVKNNENFNLPNINKFISIREQYLRKYNYVIESLPKDDRDYVYYWNCISIAETAMLQNKRALARDYYRKARSYGNYSIKTWFRKFAIPIYNLIRQK